MKTGRFEKVFVNRPSGCQRVTENAEKMLGLVGFKPGQCYLDRFARENHLVLIYRA